MGGIEDIIYGILGWKVLASARIDGKNVVAVKKRGKRELIYDHVIHSQLFDNSLFTHQYWDYFMPLPAVFQRPKVLMIGLGGGTIPFQLERTFGNKAEIDVVEISDEMVRLSEAFLPKRLDARIIVEDGYSYIGKQRGKYDLIISDPYVSGNIPGEFFDERFVKNIHDALSPDGILAINYALTLRAVAKRHGLMARLKRLFKVYTVNYAHPPGNVVIVASKKYDFAEILSRINKNFPKTEESMFLLKAYAKVR